jgi:hypothetical protein
MKTISKTTMILVFILTATSIFGQSESSEQLTVPLSSPGKSYTLKVNLVQGSIKIVGYEGKDIVIDVTAPGSKAGREMEKDPSTGMKRISSSGSYEVIAKENDNTVTVNTSNPNKTFFLSLKVPQDVKLKASTVNNGTIEIENVKGELELNNVNGGIKVTGISGSVVSNTVNGDITTTFNLVDPKAPMAFSTLNGNINVTFPSDTKANLKLKSEMGEVFSDFDIDIDKTRPKTNKTNEPGMYKIKMEDWIYGKINGGGSEILMKNMHGNIYIKKSGK